MKTSEALRKTLDNLWDGWSDRGERYGCWAAHEAGTKEIVCPILLKLLDGAGSLEAWLKRKGIHVGHRFVKVQATRDAWLTHLIEHYESIGD